MSASTLLVGLIAALAYVGSCANGDDPCQLGYRRDPESAQCIACPSCFQEVAVEYNETVQLYQQLLDRLNLTREGGLTAELLARLIQYRQTLNVLLETAVNVTDREPRLLGDVRAAQAEAEGYRDLIDAFGANVSTAENATAVLTIQVNDSQALLMRLQSLVRAIEVTLRVEVRIRLEEASELYQDYLIEFTQLIEYSTQANITASEQYYLALELLSQAKQALNQSREAFNLLCRAIALQEQTSMTLDTLEVVNLPILTQLYEEVRDALLRAEVLVPNALNQSRAALDEITNIFIPFYNTTALDLEVDELAERTSTLFQSTNLVDSQLTALRDEFSTLSVNVSRLVDESRELRSDAFTILAAAHGANALAKEKVDIAQQLFDRANRTLVELRRRLAEMMNFTDGLEELLRNIRMAELGSMEAETEAKQSAQELSDAMRLAEQVARQLEEAEGYLAEALEAARESNVVITQTLSNATSLNATSQELVGEVEATESHIASLEAQARRDQRNIATAQTDALEAITTAEVVQSRIQELQRIIQELSEELEATELLPSERFTEVEGTVLRMEEQAEQNQKMVDELTAQVDELQESSRQLRERYMDLLRHNDLLQDILESIEPLDCRSQFSG